MNWDELDELVDTDPIRLRDIAWEALTEASHFHRDYDHCVAENERLRAAMAEQTAKHQQWVQNQMDARIEVARLKEAAHNELETLKSRVRVLAAEWTCDDPGCDREGGDYILDVLLKEEK